MFEKELLVITIKDDTVERPHHPHHVRIFSEIDEHNHSFGVKDETTLGHVFDAFYQKTEQSPADHDIFICEETSENLAKYRDDSFAAFREKGRCDGLVWIFNHKGHEPDCDGKVAIYVEGIPHKWSKEFITYAEVVTLEVPDYLQHPEITYAVTYKNGCGEKPEGILLKGQKVKVKEGMRFNVSETGQS
jgi:hypothetical protein